MNQPVRVFIGLSIVAALTACAPNWRTDYLNRARGGATRDDVTQRLGAPHFTRELDAGGSVWVYQYRGIHSFVTGVGDRTFGGGSYCFEYILTFDENRVLRDWKEQGCD